MKQSIINAAIAACFLMDEAESQQRTGGGGKSEGEKAKVKKPLVTVPEGAVDSWLAEGKKWGTKVRDAIDRGEMLARETLLVFGEYLAGEEGAGDFLTGYASAFPNPNTGKVRKAEAKAVFDAFAIGDEQRTLPISYDREKKEVVKETHTIAEWLKMHNDLNLETFKGYAGLIRMAKQCRGAATGQGSGGGARRKSTVTDKQQKEVEELIPLMNSAQSMNVIEKATSQITKLAPNVAVATLFREMAMICNKIKVMGDEGHAKVASEILDSINAHLDRIAADEANRTAKGLPQAPTPATAPKQTEQPKPEVETTTPATGTHG